MNKKGGYLLIIIMCFLISIGIGINLYLISSDDSLDDEIEIKSDGVTQETLSITNLTLIPSESKKYEIGLSCKMAGNYIIRLKYDEKEDGGLKEFVDVAISINDSILYEGGLSNLLAGELLEFETYLSNDEKALMVISYQMPIGIGNEAKNTYSSFIIDLTISTQ